MCASWNLPMLCSSFRHSLYECLHRRGEALFELTDAVLTVDGALPSPVHLSLQTSHRRGWGSLYAALWRGRIDTEPSELLARHPLAASETPVYAVDTSVWPHATQSVAPSAASTTILRATLQASRSWPDGPTSSSHNSTSPARVGLLPWTSSASELNRMPMWSLPSR